MNWTDERIEAALTSLAAEIDWPQGPDLSIRMPGPIGTTSDRPRRWLAIAAAAIVIVLFSLTGPGQEAVAWLLRVSGIRVEFSEPPVSLPPPTTLVGGVEASLAEAEREVGFDLKQPQALSAPDSIQLLSWGGGREVAMLWNAGGDLPEVFETGIGLLLIQFEARVDEQLLLKEAPPATQVTPVRVNGEQGFFLSGAPHRVYFENPEGLIADDEIRLARNVLVWMSGGVTYRIESTLGLEDSLRIAESLG